MALVSAPQPQALSAPGQLYQLIADTIPHMVWTARADGWVDFHNGRCLEYTGLSVAELEGWGWKEMVHPDDRERCLASWTRALQTGERYDIEYRLRRADGIYRWHHGAAVPTRDAGGHAARWFGTCTDIEADVRSAQILEGMVEERTRTLRAILDTEPECVKVLNASGHLLQMNAAGLRMVEADSLEALHGQCVYPLIVEQHRDAFRDLTERVCRGERGTLEFEIVGLKGARRWLETHAVPFVEEATGATRLLAITRDISDRKAAEHRFETFMNHMPMHAWIRDARSHYRYVNRLYAQASGTEPAAMLGREVGEFFPPELARRFRETDRQVLRGGAPLQFVDALPSGQWLKVKFPLPGPRGDVGVAGVALDVSERSRLEEALRQSEQRFRFFMSNLPARAWIKDGNFRYTYVNPTFETGTRLAADDVLGRNDFEIFPPDVAGKFRAGDNEVLEAGVPMQHVRQLVSAGRDLGHWLVVKFPLPDALGRTGIAGIGIDMSERAEAEKRAREYLADVRRLMGRLVVAQESERRRIADDLHDLIGQNLTALSIGLATLKAHPVAEVRDAVTPRVDAMASLLDGTMDAIRGVMAELRPVALEEFGLLAALRWYAAEFGNQTGMKVVVSSSGREARYASDVELALFRIVQEALTNAAKHSGGTTAHVMLSETGEGVRMVVEDDGRGFAEPAGARRAQRGGWGLPAMRERAEAHGGSLRVEFPASGTRLVVDIPVSHAH
jgi:PAS domain S-box-containing protein